MISNKAPIRRQLLTGFGITLGIFLVAGAIAYWFLLKLEHNIDTVVHNRYPKVMMAQGIIKRVIDNGRQLRGAAMTENPADAEKIIEKILENRKRNGEDMTKLEGMMNTPQGKEMVGAMIAARDKLGPLYDKAIVLIRSGDRAKTAEFLKEVGAANNALWDAAEAFGKYQESEMEKSAVDAGNAAELVQAILIGSTILAIAIGIFIALSQSKQISQRLGQAVAVAGAIAQGRLDSNVQDSGGDEIADLLKAMSSMQQGLSSLVVDIQAIVSAAEQGNLGQRMSLSGRQGFGLEIGQSLNRLVETADTSLRDISRVSVALASGDLSQKIEAKYAGAFGETANAVNKTVEVLSAVIGEVREMVNAASEGDFSKQIGVADKQGYALVLAQLLNTLGNTANEALTDISRVAQSLAKGDLTQSIERQYPGLFGSTAGAINAISENLQSLIGNIVEAVGLINTAAKEIASGNQDLSSRTEEQASSLEETASSMEELTSTVKQNSENARQASDLASNAKLTAVKGGEVVHQVVETMTTIHQSSSKIANIIGVIDGIAFQTNILALNAAVEAARAGEQGRGFAVVATEVRNLAQRSATAAKEIKDLIADSVSKVEAGNQQVAQAGRTMEEVVLSIQNVANIMAEISGASREQTAGIEQVSLAVGQMDEVTQQNAALVEEAAAAAESLEEQAHALAVAVGRFKLSTSQTSVAQLPPMREAPRAALSRPAAKLSAPPTSSLDDHWEEF
ncbi:methyl-accepting chemotaxis protein [Azonexus sp. IMCC34839]|uniref:methyl-accepting chemotaxis protein n=1 Tax=Azonexus sp. IMCC34839 TaxID=3133695 RepID=UPI00399B3D04